MTLNQIFFFLKHNCRSVLSVCAGILAASIIASAVEIHPQIQKTFFTSPAASVASLFLGTPRIEDGSDILLAGRAGFLRVTPECSGVTFWAMANGLLFFVFFRRPVAAARLLYTATLLPGIWVFSIFVNGMRIAASYYVALIFSSGFLPRFSAGAHLWTGVLFFIPALAGFYIFIQWSGIYEQK